MISVSGSIRATWHRYQGLIYRFALKKQQHLFKINRLLIHKLRLLLSMHISLSH